MTDAEMVIAICIGVVLGRVLMDLGKWAFLKVRSKARGA